MEALTRGERVGPDGREGRSRGGDRAYTSTTPPGAALPRAPDAAASPGLDGRLVSVFERKLARGGRLRVTIDGRSRTVRVRGRSGHRSVLWVSPRLPAGAHVLRLRSLGGGPVELDAVAPSP